VRQSVASIPTPGWMNWECGGLIPGKQFVGVSGEKPRGHAGEDARSRHHDVQDQGTPPPPFLLVAGRTSPWHREITVVQ